MTDAEKDPMLRRAIEALRRLPDADPERVKRVVLAAAAARVAPAEDEAVNQPPRRSNAARFSIAAGLIAAGVLIGFVGRVMLAPRASSTPPTQIAAAPAQTMHVASTSSSDVVALPQQFVLRSATARVVSVVGDFNDWNPKRSPLTRSADGDWSTIIPVLPGRHLYGFMVDDSLFVLDPRAPRAHDPDLGSEGSVIIVGRP
jgi:hypothetical protein